MIISEKQLEANRRNALHSTGPKTPEGKAAVRLNAVTYGLRARSTLIAGEDPQEYKRLWVGLEAEWQPQTPTERLHLEQMAISQWVLARIARGERQIFEADLPVRDQFVLLGYASTQRMRLERSFTSAMRELKQLQKERQSRQWQPAQTAKPAIAPISPPREPSTPHPDYVMSAGTQTRDVSDSPIAPDSR